MQRKRRVYIIDNYYVVNSMCLHVNITHANDDLHIIKKMFRDLGVSIREVEFRNYTFYLIRVFIIMNSRNDKHDMKCNFRLKIYSLKL